MRGGLSVLCLCLGLSLHNTAAAVRIAAAQILVNDGDVDGNWARIEHAVAAAAAKGAEIVVFPETSVGGWMWNEVPAPPIPGESCQGSLMINRVSTCVV